MFIISRKEKVTAQKPGKVKPPEPKIASGDEADNGYKVFRLYITCRPQSITNAKVFAAANGYPMASILGAVIDEKFLESDNPK